MIGFAGSDDKVKWLTDDLKFDAAFNYKTTDITTALKEAAPEGVDCYFDNVSVFQKQVYEILRQTAGLLRLIEIDYLTSSKSTNTRNYINLKIFFTRQPCQGFNLSDISETDSGSLVRFLTSFDSQPVYISVLDRSLWWPVVQMG